MANNGSPTPIFDTNEERDYFLTILPIHEQFSSNVQKAKDGVQDGVQDDFELSNFAKKILLVINDNSQSKQEIMQLINQAKITKSTRNAFTSLLELQLIAYTLPDKPSSKNQRYVLTANGRQYLKNMSALNKVR